MANKKIVVFISIISGIILLTIGLLITLNIVNNKVEEELETKFTGLIQISGFEENITYSEIKVSSANGRVTLNQVKLQMPDDSIEIITDSVYIIIPPMEAVSIAKDPQNAILSKVQVGIENLNISIPNLGIETSIDSLKLSIKGELSQQIFQEGVVKFLDKKYSLEFSIDGSTIIPDETIIAQIQMYLDITDPKAIFSAIELESMKLNVVTSSSIINLKEFSMDSSIIKFNGNMGLKLNEMMEPVDVVAELAVDRLNNDLRSAITPYLEMMDLQIPEKGSFKIKFVLPEGGVYKITLE